MNEKVRWSMIASMVVAAMGLIAIGLIGMERTFACYGRIDVALFGAYIVASTLFIVIGAGLGFQSIYVMRNYVLVSIRGLPKPPVPKQSKPEEK